MVGDKPACWLARQPFAAVFPGSLSIEVTEETWDKTVDADHGTLIMFICNHCPYVKAVIDRIVRDAREIKKFGVNSAAICSRCRELSRGLL